MLFFKNHLPEGKKSIIIFCLCFFLVFYLFGFNGIVHSEETSFSDNQQTQQGKENEAVLNSGIVVMLLIILVMLILFILEPIRVDLTALLIPVALVVLNNWTKMDTSEALSGFSNRATITALAMFILSEGVQNSGLVQMIENLMFQITGDSEVRQVGFVTSFSGMASSFLYNTPVVAIFIPFVTDLARKSKISPSKLLIPLSYAATMGGMLTVIGSGTNILASDISGRLIGKPFALFEFTKLGFFVLVTGVIYFILIGRHLLPKRVEPEEDLVEEYEMKLFIAEVVVEQDSPLIGKSINQTLNQMELDLDLVMITRDGEEFVEPLEAKSIKAGDRLVIRSDRNTLIQVMDTQGLSFPLKYQIEEKKLEQPEEGRKLIEGVITNGSIFAGKTLTELNFMERYDCSVLALRRGSELSHYRLDEIVLQAGDVLLMVTNKSTLERLRQRRDIIITREMEQKDYQREKIPYVIGIMAGVVFFGVTELVPLSVAALLGIALMVITGCINPAEMYQSVNWEIIILMAGLIPLGTAMGKTGTADFLAAQIIKLIGDLPGVYLLALFYLFTALVTNIMSNRASIVVMLPVAVDTALRLGAAPFPFILAVTFAANTAYLTPIANQVHLLVFGPGGYRFGDYFRVGLPLQLILTVVVTTGLLLFWGI